MSDTIYRSEIGLEVYKQDWDSPVTYCISGNVPSKYTIKEFDSAYEFEEHVQKNVACKGIEFDSETCQFFAYAKTKQQAVAFVKRIEKHFEKLQEMFA